METKDTNPKDSVGATKLSMSRVPMDVMAEVALGLMEGDRKYGGHNYRVAGARGSIYFDAAMRHLMKWWEGQDIDEDSGLSHITKAITSLVVLRAAMLRAEYIDETMFVDDRPPMIDDEFWDNIQERVDELLQKYPDRVKPYTQIRDEQGYDDCPF